MKYQLSIIARTPFLLLLFSCGFLFAFPSFAVAVPDVDEIMHRAFNRDQPTTTSAIIEMKLLDKNGNQRIRRLKSLIKRENDITKRIFFFLDPPEVKNSAFLTFDYLTAEREDEQWIYLPAHRKTRRVSSSKRSGSFMGSDFSYGDLTQKSVDEYQFKILKILDQGDYQEWAIEALPTSEDINLRDGFSKSLYIVRQDNFLITKIVQWINKSNKLKYFEIQELKQLDGYLIPVKVQVKTVSDGTILHETILTTSEIKINQPLPENLFSIRTLEKGL
ncbi:MAG: outer membrane lipoprotein-sorting protein [Desulfobulbaceae bacterium]|nr:MAG: outer membrane lipoprotein-sorting protein [Desulfobulbaceae bacterium]